MDILNYIRCKFKEPKPKRPLFEDHWYYMQCEINYLSFSEQAELLLKPLNPYMLHDFEIHKLGFVDRQSNKVFIKGKFTNETAYNKMCDYLDYSNSNPSQ